MQHYKSYLRNQMKTVKIETVHALDCAATLIGSVFHLALLCFSE
jgi:hypothetical protein